MSYTPKHLCKSYKGKRYTMHVRIPVATILVTGIFSLLLYYGGLVPGKGASRPTPSPALTTPSEDVSVAAEPPVITPTPEPTPTPREPIVMDYTIKQGALYTMDNVIQWETSIAEYLEYTDLTDTEKEQLELGMTMCQTITTLTTYVPRTGETLPQMLAKIVSQEIGGLTDATSYSTANMERAAVVWCILNRVDLNYGVSGDSKAIVSVAKSPNQFAYSYTRSIMTGTEEISVDVLIRWVLERNGYAYGRVLPLTYIYFTGNGRHNIFRDAYSRSKAHYWDWSSDDPYKMN